jgi:hypothetical protein
MDNFDSLPAERNDRAVQNSLSESAASLLSQDTQCFRIAQCNQATDANLPNAAIASDDQKPVVERTSHNIGAAVIGGIIGGVASELLLGHRPYYPPPPVYNYPYPGYPYPGYPQPYPGYPQPYPQPYPGPVIPIPIPVPGWGHGHGHGGHHGRRHW